MRKSKRSGGGCEDKGSSQSAKSGARQPAAGAGQAPPEGPRPSREDLFFSGFQKRPVSALNRPVWRHLLLVAAACLIGWGLDVLTRPGEGWLRLAVMALVLAVGWLLAVKLLLLETKARVFWMIWLLLGIVPLVLSTRDRLGWLPSAFSAFVFLLFRRYRPYRHLTSRRQTALFGVGFILLVLVTVLWRAPVPAATSQSPDVASAVAPIAPGPSILAANVLKYSLYSLRWFWFFSLFNLFFSIRLHFMKIRPKLAVAGFFLVIVPLVLLVILGLGTLYTTLGESHAARARSILGYWAELAARDPDFVRSLSDSWFAVGKAPTGPVSSGRAPGWAAEALGALSKPAPDLGFGAAPHGFYFVRDKTVWLLVLSPSSGGFALRGCPVNEAFLDGLASIVRSDVVLGSSNPLALATIKSDLAERDLAEIRKSGLLNPEFEVRGVPERARPETQPAAALSFWRRTIYFGVTQLDVFTLEQGNLVKASLMLQTPRSLATTTDELFSASNPLGAAAMASLVGLGFVFLLLETLALIFGLRVSGGITKAIKTLHRHLCCVSEGDLESRIEIPNEDELGDLAASFNQMTAAIRQGREEAIARERLEKELETARLIQERLLPHAMPALAGFEVSGTSRPSHEVGGDYFDFLDLDATRLGVAIADVSGKGIPAALLMANLQASLRAQSLERGEVSSVAARLNALLVRNTDERTFITFFYGILDRVKATFTYTNAGHNPPLLIRADGRLERLEAGGMILGFLADQAYDQSSAGLEAGDVLVLFTDGITEAVNPEAATREEKYFGEERLVGVLRANLDRTAVEIQGAVLAAVADHTRRSEPTDDITLVIIKRTGGRESLAYVS